MKKEKMSSIDHGRENNLLKIKLRQAEAVIRSLQAQQEELSKTVTAISDQNTSDQTYRIFIEQMTEGAVSLNKDGIIIYCNEQFGKMVALPVSGINGMHFSSFISNEDKKAYTVLIATGWLKETRGELTLTGMARNIPVQLSIKVLELYNGSSLSIILTDLTAQKQTQLLLKANNEKLQQINYELELSNQDLHQFATVASHDLQEPLRKIQIFSNFLKEKFAGEFSKDAYNYLEKIIGASNRMKTLIIDILNYSQLSQDENMYSVSDLNEILSEVLEDYELRIAERKAQIISEKLPSIEVNPGQMRQVFQNLISNSLKFSGEDRIPQIHISSKIMTTVTDEKNAEVEGGYCYLTFKDNGIGFDDKFAKNIFTLFRRLHAKDRFEGTGIGLAISKKIVEKHNGHIIAKGVEGIGSEFIILLPVSQRSN